MYDPFIDGERPVGVRTIEIQPGIKSAENALTTEVWYPVDHSLRDSYDKAVDTFVFTEKLPSATQRAIRDAEPADGKWPVIIYWHGGYGHRREMAGMCVFLASHGFVAVAPDFPGDHITYVYSDDPAIKQRPIDDSAKARPQQGGDFMEGIASRNDPFLSLIADRERMGSFGMSMGGFTSLAVNSHSARQAASVAIAPMCGTRSPLPQIGRLGKLLSVDDWKSDVSTFLLTGSADALVIVDDVRELYERIPGPKQFVILKNAGHVHWADNAEQVHETMRLSYLSGQFPDPEIDGPALSEAFRPFSELCSAQDSADTMRAICLTHFNGKLKGDTDALQFMSYDLANTFAARGIDIE